MTPDGFPGSWRPNPASSVALFEQLRLQVIHLADNGALAPGTRLPAVRALAEKLDVAPHTVARAYKELEAAGVVATRGRHGTVVSARDERLGDLSQAAAAYAAVAKSRGASFAEAVKLLAAAYDVP
ncbi:MULTISPECIES: GntR family transcriptional regulator [Pseudarthrobacter]|uniref:DNA-binding transcriptional regulator YhcF (GntR family) n=1 Tax=Pseudarthrobacter niigatensis TaxID=369935 RepID=A0AAJ1SP82_9MICC|nr:MULTISPECIES: GntR family transcriptional regulator [Pseudarthrobacter]MDQ0144506.1 DNA-binding transcriptional regulator YhcF (GntR family) [Pseudarthrobacter niigatensis]QDG63576.1 GntR family transcriptional regulator [Pseudarthrobacter sp. NIBRBAC000502771]